MHTRKTAAIAVAIIALAGCSSGHKTSVETNGGTVTTETSADQKTTTVTSQGSTVKMGQGAVDPAKLGLPVYPGATAADGGSWAMQSKEGGGEMVTLTTTDAFDKVEAWYKSKLPAGSEAMNMTSGDSSSAVFKIGKEADSDQSSVLINGEKDKTTITLTHQAKKGS
jgi:hypothetical protein